MNRSYKYLFFALLFIVPFSCSKKFLEEPSRTVTIADLLNQPSTGAERLIAAVYSKLYDWNVHTFSWIGVSSITSDDADKGSFTGDAGTDKDLLDNWSFLTSSISFDEVWIGNFEGIGRACYALKFIPEMDLPLAEKNRYTGEAKLLRAYFYWNLVRTFGGVPKIDHILVSQDDILSSSKRASETEIYAFIESDLNDAVSTLPPTVTTAERGRVTKGAAQALLAKVYLYQKKWSQSKSMCDAITVSNLYSLVSDYATIWREAGEFSSESIWEVNAVGVTPNKGVQQYSQVQSPNVDGLGWGFNTPSQDLVNAYEAGDKRKAATILTRGQTLWDGFTVNSGAPNLYSNYKAWVSHTMESYNGDNENTNKNLRLFRYGEILLIKAEVENELNDTSAAIGPLNQIRNRAGLAGIYAVSKDDLRNAIYKERRVEMAFEHDRTFDLRRTGRAAAVLQALGKPYVSPKHDLFPIPQHQIELSGNSLEQNTGY